MQILNFRIHKLYSQPTVFKKLQQTQKFGVLDYLLYAISGIIILLWAIGFIGLNIKSGIHILFIIAANLILLGVIQHQKVR